MRTSRVLTMLAAVLVGLLVAAPGSAQNDPVERAAGADRIGTAVDLSAGTFSSADTAVLATAVDFPDALTGGVLAAKVGGPLLLTFPSTLPDAVLQELERLGAQRVILLGGTGAIGAEVQQRLEADGYDVDRIAGADRWDTAARVAMAVTDGAAVDRVVLVTGEDFPDAVSASAYAAANGWPILLTPRNLPSAAVRSYLSEADPNEVIPIGGPAAITDHVLETYASDGHPIRARLHGPSRYATSYAVARAHVAAMPDANTVFVASGDNFPDALAAGPAAASTGALLVLSAAGSTDLPDGADVRQFMEEQRACDGSGALQRAVLAGGTAALADAVEAQLEALLACQPFPEPEPGPEDCHPAYPDFCIPPPPPDLNCSDFSEKGFTVDHTHGDPHNLDGNQDGIACEG